MYALMRTKVLKARQSKDHDWCAISCFHSVPDDTGRMEAIADAALNLTRSQWSRGLTDGYEYKIETDPPFPLSPALLKIAEATLSECVVL
jgi:hypothetical protein